MQSNLALVSDNSNWEYARQACEYLPTAPYQKALKVYLAVIEDPECDNYVLAQMGLHDRYFLLTNLLNRADAYKQWVYERCREVEADPDGHIDLWAREHYKSTLITFAGSIQEIARDSDITISIFSHTRPIAKSFLSQIKQEAEFNDKLKALYPETFWRDPKRQAPYWSLDAGLVFKRHTNPKEATVEAHGLVDSQPTAKHFRLRIYDDVVTKESVYTPDMIIKTTEAWELSQHLASTEFGSEESPREWIIGTRYNYADTYAVMLQRKTAIPRIHPATDDGTPDGMPILLSQVQWDKKKRDSSTYTIACHCVGTKILMSDWTHKNIEDVKAGDEVVGFKIGVGKGQKTRLIKTKVLARNERRANCNQYALESGTRIACTPDHRWWTKRGNTNGHKQYSALMNCGHHNIKALHRIVDVIMPDRLRNPAWQYLAGMLDGEGSFSGNRITITQSEAHNKEVYDRIHAVLQELNIDYSMYHRKKETSHGKTSKGSSIFSINGGRHARHRILINANPAKRQRIIDSLYCRIGGKSSAERDPVFNITDIGEQSVYNIQTESGNYIANGYGSKNCQMLQNPLAGKEQVFKVEWIRNYEVRPETLNIALLVDPASSKKKDSSNTAMAVIGVDGQYNKYLLDGLYHKMSLTERWTALKYLYYKWLRARGIQVVKVGYEKYGMQADIEHFEEMMKIEKKRFPINEVSWPRDDTRAKDDRIKRLIPDHENWRFFYPYTGEETTTQREARQQNRAHLIAKPIKRKDEDGRIYDVFEKMFKNEYIFFPATTAKDFMDAMSRIYDLNVTAPQVVDDKDLYPDPDDFEVG